jgi:hypothetical protein
MPFEGSKLPDTFGTRTPSSWSGLRNAFRSLFSRVGPVHLFAPEGPVVPREVVVVHVLCAARALIELEDKWVQGRYETIRGRRCAVGALKTAGRMMRDPYVFAFAIDLLRSEAVSRGFSHIEKMNDHSTHGRCYLHSTRRSLRQKHERTDSLV